jgi:hypothetical protein
MVDEERSALLKRRLEGGEFRTEFDDELPDCADINGVEIGLVELKRFRNGFRKLRARCRFVPFDFLGFARVFVEGAGNREPTEILVVVENPDASLGEPVELCREITFCLARFARVACSVLRQVGQAGVTTGVVAVSRAVVTVGETAVLGAMEFPSVVATHSATRGPSRLASRPTATIRSLITDE